MSVAGDIDSFGDGPHSFVQEKQADFYFLRA